MTTPRKILVVDDNAGLRDICAALLVSKGYEVETAEDGFIGLLRLDKSVPDLIVCDLRLPAMSGFEFLSVVRRRFPEIRVLAMSGAYVGDPDSLGILADGFYSKGQDPLAFIETVVALLETSASFRQRRTD